MPHHLCEYLFKLANQFSDFYSNCRVVGDPKQNRCASAVVPVWCPWLAQSYRATGYTAYRCPCTCRPTCVHLSRLLLCHATALVVRQCMELLGISPIDRL